MTKNQQSWDIILTILCKDNDFEVLKNEVLIAGHTLLLHFYKKKAP